MKYEVMDGESVTNVIVANADFMAVAYPAGNYREAATPVVPLRPELVVVGITCDPAALGINQVTHEVTCTEGSKVTANCELRMNGAILPVTDTFRMPTRSSDGREEFVVAQMSDGVVAATFNARASGLWSVTESGINERAAAGHEMKFSGVTVFVVQS